MTLAEKIKTITEEIQHQFLADDTPWVVGYSGGKDSTAVVQLIMYALMKLPKEQLKKEIHILSNDTLVENPTIVNYIDQQLKLIDLAGKSKLYVHKPNHFQVKKVIPKIEDRFWINLIGKGYPSPNRWFRWCTDRMKINPTNDYILQQVSKYGKAIIVLGARKTESANRAKSMEKYNLDDITQNGSKFRKHSLPNAWVYAPINELTTEEVWTYLMQVPSFWGGDNKKLITMYRNASDGANECPLVIDTSTSSCGNSRFGCWVCTVVKKDKSMENLIESGEEWMIPMLDFRNYLAEVRDDETKRMKKSRDNKDRLGPFTFETRAELLQKLLEIEVKTNLEIISKQELSAIHLQWNYDGCFEYNVGEIYLKIKNKMLMLDNRQLQEKEKEELELLREVAEVHQVNADHIRTLLLTEKEYVTFLRRSNVLIDIQRKIEGFVKENELNQQV
ncbi:MAG: DNA phosphorothioation system sulfurtransferase DndC [Microscillaceae bacterium]|jgi:DNA sulfur modification protein DndC|nr:DNA phosphorothioation system sulfurtransferase DndC [Microscillaceae bacterium]